MKHRWLIIGSIIMALCAVASIGNNNAAAMIGGALSVIFLCWLALKLYLEKKGKAKALKKAPETGESEAGSEGEGKAKTPITKCRYVRKKAPVVGVNKLEDRSGFDEARIGDRVYLAFVGGTTADRKAIAVYDSKSRFLGYISKRSEARTMCYDWFRRDERMEAYVDGIERNEAMGQNTLVTITVKYE